MIRQVRPMRPVERKDGEVIAAHLVQHHHIEWCRRRPLLVETADVEAVGVRAAVQNRVEGPLVAVECKHHRLVRGEQFDEA